MTRPGRVVPVPDAESAPFWSAAADHVLTVARCSVCSMLMLPPDVVCPHCGSATPDFIFTPVSGRGTIRSWTVMHRSFLPGFEADLPFVLVDVELDEQSELRVIGRLLDGAATTLTCGAAVEVAFEDIAPGVSIPAFTLTATR